MCTPPFTKTPKVRNPREAAAYTFGYNHSVFVHRVHDVLSAVKYVTTHERPTKQLTVVGVDGAGPVVAAARAMCGAVVHRAFIDTEGFRFGKVSDIHAPEFLPGGAKYGDLPGMLALAAPAETLLAGETPDSAALAVTQYQEASAGMKLKFVEAKEAGAVRAAAVKFALGE